MKVRKKFYLPAVIDAAKGKAQMAAVLELKETANLQPNS